MTERLEISFVGPEALDHVLSIMLTIILVRVMLHVTSKKEKMHAKTNSKRAGFNIQESTAGSRFQIRTTMGS
jgi:hypothetical protein